MTPLPKCAETQFLMIQQWLLHLTQSETKPRCKCSHVTQTTMVITWTFMYITYTLTVKAQSAYRKLMSLIHIIRYIRADLEFLRLESWSQDVSRPVFTSLGLDLGLGTSESWSWSWNPRVSVLVLEPPSLGLSLGLGTSESWSWSWDLRPQRLGSVRLPPLFLWNGYLAIVVC